jgi:hypothetical protein
VAGGAPNVTGIHRPIVGFHRDAEGDWVAELSCGHGQHVRHKPPWQLRPWVLTEEGRHEKMGTSLLCVKCGLPQATD